MIKTFLDVPLSSHFSIHNIPFGVCTLPELGAVSPRVCSAIGNFVVDLQAVSENGLWSNPTVDYSSVFKSNTLNAFMALGRTHWWYIRSELQRLLAEGSPLSSNTDLLHKCLYPMEKATMLLPMHIGDYTDFYASKEHAVNVGTMFRGKENALNPNWLHIPIGYHGRASSIVVSGTNITRPCGQIKPPDSDQPVISPSKKMDFELEMAFVVGTGNALGDRISVDSAEEHIFGVVIMNDWSARDIQAWEYVPLGPFLGKNFGTTVSPWVVTLDALEAVRVSGPPQDEPKPLHYLQTTKPMHYNVTLEVYLKPAGDNQQEYLLARSNLRNLYWSFAQQLAHHTINGCNMQPGDLCGTGTISGSTKESFGSLLELSWNGKEPLQLAPNVTRSFIEDGDTIRMTAFCETADGRRVGFGDCVGTLLPARSAK